MVRGVPVPALNQDLNRPRRYIDHPIEELIPHHPCTHLPFRWLSLSELSMQCHAGFHANAHCRHATRSLSCTDCYFDKFLVKLKLAGGR